MLNIPAFLKMMPFGLVCVSWYSSEILLPPYLW